MAEEETVPDIDWGLSEATISSFTFSQLPRRPGVLRFRIVTKDLRETDFIITHNAIIGLQQACAEARQKLGF